MRSSNSIKNAVVATIMNMVIVFIGFIAQRVFLQNLGTEYLGINGLFTNILSMLGIVELGLGSAIIYHLYQPIAENNKSKIKSFLLFYKVSYRVIGFIIAILGLLLIPFIAFIVGEVSIPENIIYIYLLFLIDIVFPYLLTYKRSILYANQKTYIINLVHIGYLMVMNVGQLITLVLTKNYIVYLWIKIICRILENIVITQLVNKMYPYIRDKKVEPLDKKERKSIFKKIKGLIYHKIGSFIVFGTDNILISFFLGVVTVGMYSNYYLVIATLNNLFSQLFHSITASVGNLLVEEDKEKSYQVYQNILFFNSWLYTVACSGLLCVMEPFIEIWIGSEFLLSFSVLMMLVINFYFQGMRKTCNTFKEAAGIFYEDRYVAVLESIINVVASIIFIKLLGLMGVFMGTIISTFVLFFYGYPKFVYKPLFERTYQQYIKDYIPYILVTILSGIITYFTISCIQVGNPMLQVMINIILVGLIPNTILMLLFCKTESFQYYKELFSKIVKRNKVKK